MARELRDLARGRLPAAQHRAAHQRAGRLECSGDERRDRRDKNVRRFCRAPPRAGDRAAAKSVRRF
jgi:hypothetical protein